MGSHQRHDSMPTHPMTASHRPNRHRPGVLHQPARKPPGETPLKLVMLLEVPLPTVAAHEPPTPPHQRRPPARHPKVADPLDPPIPHPTAAEPAIRAPRPLPRRLHLHLQAVNRIDRHTQHPNTTQPQANGHNIRHRGLLASANWYFTDFSEASPPNQGFQAPAPTYSRRAEKSAQPGTPKRPYGASTKSTASQPPSDTPSNSPTTSNTNPAHPRSTNWAEPSPAGPPRSPTGTYPK